MSVGLLGYGLNCKIIACAKQVTAAAYILIMVIVSSKTTEERNGPRPSPKTLDCSSNSTESKFTPSR